MGRTVLFLIVFMQIQTELLFCQQDIQLPGIVVEQNSRYKTGQIKYLSGVSVKSPGATPSVSTATGSFTLLFADRPLGGKAAIFVAKSGFDVVNKKELESAGVIGRKEPLKVVMCDPDELYKNQVAYYNIVDDAVRKNYDRQLQILKGEGHEKDELIAQLQLEMNRKIESRQQAIDILEQQRQGLEERVQELANKFVTVNLDDQSDTYIRAFEAFKAGDLDRTIAILDSVDLAGRLATNEAARIREEQTVRELEEKIAIRKQQTQQDIEQVALKARAQRLNFQFDAAEASYELALQYDTLNMDLRWEYADMLAALNQFDKAVYYYEQILGQTHDEQKRSEALVDMGIVLKGGGRNTDEAEKSLKEALAIQRRLAEKDPGVALPKLAGVLNNLGVLYLKNGPASRAELYLVEALSIRRELFKKDSSMYLPELAQTLNNLGVAYKNQGSRDKAGQLYTEALNMYKRLDKIEPQGSYLSYIATTLNNLGGLLGYPWDIDKMKNTYGEALNIYRNLANRNPKAYNLDLSSTAYNISLFYRQKLDFEYDESFKNEGLAQIQTAENALSIYPESVPVVGKSLNNIKNLKQYFLSITPESAQKNIANNKIRQLEGSLDIEKTAGMGELDPFPYGRVADQTVQNASVMGNNSRSGSKSDESSPKDDIIIAGQSIPRTKELIELYRSSAAYSKNDPEAREKLADAYNRLAHDYLYTKNFSEAEMAAREGLSSNPAATRINVNLALALLFQGKWDDVEKLLKQFKDREPANQSLFLAELDQLEKADIKDKSAKKARKLLGN